MTKRVIFPTGSEALQREGVSAVPEVWEDGLRAPTSPGFFEWWYFDAHFDDGSTAVIVFFTKPMIERNAPLKPAVSITITRPDGKRIIQSIQVPPVEFSSSKEHCYVRSGESWVRGNLRSYELYAKVNDVSAHLTFEGLVPSWRPGAGKNYYDEAQTQFFGWLPAIPHGVVEGFLTYDGKMRPVKGTCYHDHNWGNVGLNEVLSHWVWGRAHIADYTLIFVEMTAAKDYGSQKVPVFMLAKKDQILTGDGEPLRLITRDHVEHTGKRSYPQKVDFHWEKGADCVHLALRDPQLIEAASLLDLLPPFQRFVGRLFSNPYYFRFNAALDLDIRMGDLEDRQSGRALYEIMLLR